MAQWIVAAGVLLGGASAALFEAGGDADRTKGTEVPTLPAEWPQLRIDTQLFVNGQKQRHKPRSLFDDGKVYDYLNGPGEVTIFEPAEKRFTLLHRSKGLACRVSLLEIERHLEQLRREALEAVRQAEEQPTESSLRLARLVRWGWQPTFQEIYDPQLRQLKLKSPYVVYSIRGVPMERFHGASREQAAEATDGVAAALRSYWDWYARLNARLNGGALPPAARLEVNDRLVAYRLVPEEVELQLLFGQPTTVRAAHKTSAGLRPEDHDRLEDTRRSLSAARIVSLEEYLRATSEKQ